METDQPPAVLHSPETTRPEPATDDFASMDVPFDDKDDSLLIESSKTEDLSAALRCGTGGTPPPKRKRKTRRGKKKLRGGATGPPAEKKDGAAGGGGRNVGVKDGVPLDSGDTSVENGDGAAAAARPGKDGAAAAAPAGSGRPAGKKASTRRQRRRRSNRLPPPILRPLEVPHAPLNSTSFIIDDHENSTFYIDFDARSRPSDGGWSTADEADEEAAAVQFSVRDFETVYRNAREEALSLLPRQELADRVRQLERRLREAQAELSLNDPQVWVTNLQNQLLQLQEENRLLRKTREALISIHGEPPT